MEVMEHNVLYMLLVNNVLSLVEKEAIFVSFSK